jgi:hypothetical protein
MDAGTIMTISKDRVKPSPHPDSWKLNEIFITGIVYGSYLALMTVIFFWAMRSTDFFTVSSLDLSLSLAVPIIVSVKILSVQDADELIM